MTALFSLQVLNTNLLVLMVCDTFFWKSISAVLVSTWYPARWIWSRT